eukprot:TRINITY_DN11396_c0_g1_i1.p1 TRINITY_DN11396_c0_g1~~TRINITY_DN11396_c0_g1_i1.p1  ORF type:complete len:458 (+),score=145.17 TRINITY_DN11396_c0_g1_i1:110-1483(+)
MLRSKKVALKDLNLGNSFFEKMLILVDKTGTPEDNVHDYDIYLMEKSVMPLLVQGLDALSRHVNKLQLGEKGVGPSLSPFNPLAWLAQFLLRNHPKYVKDHRTPMYQHFTEKASIEKGRRSLLRRKQLIQDTYQVMCEDKKRAGMDTSELPELIRRLDVNWGLQGAFATRMPTSYAGLIAGEKSDKGIAFADFWTWFAEHIRSNDVLRETAFEAAKKRRADDEKQARRQKDEAAKRERAMQEALEQQAMLKEQFETLCADMYLNDEIARIMNKGAFIQGVEEKDGGVPLQGEHIALILAMLGLWGSFPSGADPEAPEDIWDEHALAAWVGLMEAQGATFGPSGAAPRVDAASMNMLMDKAAFEAYLVKEYPLHGSSLDDVDLEKTVQVRGFVEEDEFAVEAVDEETGQVMVLQLHESQVEQIKKRLQEGAEESAAVFANVDMLSNRISEVLPATKAA